MGGENSGTLLSVNEEKKSTRKSNPEYQTESKDSGYKWTQSELASVVRTKSTLKYLYCCALSVGDRFGHLSSKQSTYLFN